MEEADRFDVHVGQSAAGQSVAIAPFSAYRKNGRPTGMSPGGSASASWKESRKTPSSRIRYGVSHVVRATRPFRRVPETFHRPPPSPRTHRRVIAASEKRVRRFCVHLTTEA